MVSLPQEWLDHLDQSDNLTAFRAETQPLLDDLAKKAAGLVALAAPPAPAPPDTTQVPSVEELLGGGEPSRAQLGTAPASPAAPAPDASTANPFQLPPIEHWTGPLDQGATSAIVGTADDLSGARYDQPSAAPTFGPHASPAQLGPIDTSSPAAYLRSVLPYAQQVEQETGLRGIAPAMVAISANETGYGRAAPGNAYFGIKGPGQVSSTWESVNGQPVATTDSFRAYGSPLESFRDFAAFLQQNPRYSGALQTLQQTGDPNAFVQAVHQAGYATDPAWSSKVGSIMGNVPAAAPPAADAGPPPSGQPSPQQPGGWFALAQSQIGKPYVWGSAGGRSDMGTDPQGYDCSGFAAWVYQNGMGAKLPAQTASIYDATKPVSSDQARPGDLVMFNMSQGDPHYQHVGIYIGDGKFIHASTYAGQNGVQITPIWQGQGAEFRRLPGVDPGASSSVAATAADVADAPDLSQVTSDVPQAAAPQQDQPEQLLAQLGSRVRSIFGDNALATPPADTSSAQPQTYADTLLGADTTPAPSGPPARDQYYREPQVPQVGPDAQSSPDLQQVGPDAQSSPDVSAPLDTRMPQAQVPQNPIEAAATKIGAGIADVVRHAVSTIVGPQRQDLTTYQADNPPVGQTYGNAPAPPQDQRTTPGDLAEQFGGALPDVASQVRAGGTPDVITRAGRGEAVNPFEWSSTVGAGAAHTLLAEAPPEVRDASIGATLPTGQHVELSLEEALSAALDPAWLPGGPLDAGSALALHAAMPYLKGAARAAGERLLAIARQVPGAEAIGQTARDVVQAGRALSQAPGPVQSVIAEAPAEAAGQAAAGTDRYFHGGASDFPQAVDQLTNAVSGLPGGLVESTGVAGSDLRNRAVRGAVTGAAASGYEQSQQEGATPPDVARAMLVGAAGGVMKAAAAGVLPKGAMEHRIAQAVVRQNKAPGPNALDWLKSIGYSAMIGPTAFVTNTAGNALELLYNLPKHAIAGSVVRAGTRAPEAALSQLPALLMGPIHGGLEALDVLARGSNAAAAAGPGGAQLLSERVQNPVGKVLAHTLEAGGRLFTQAPDAFFRTIARDWGTTIEASRVATEEGLRGPAFIQRVDQIRNDIAAGVPTNEAARVIDFAEQFSKKLVYQGDMGNLGQKAWGLLNAETDNRAVNAAWGMVSHLLVPFFPTLYHVAARTAERTPVAGLAAASPGWEKAYDQVVGSTLAAGLVGLALGGNITGSGPKEPAKKQELAALGRKDKSFRVGPYYIPNSAAGYNAPLLDMAGEIADAIRYSDGAGADKIGMDLARRMGGVATDQYFLRGIADVVQAIKDPQSSLETWAGSTASRLLPYAATGRAVASAQDQYERRPERSSQVGLGEAIRQRVAMNVPEELASVSPVGTRQQLPAAQRVTGETVENVRQGMPGAPAFGVERDAPIAREFSQSSVDLPLQPPREIAPARGWKVDLLPAEQRRWRELFGEELSNVYAGSGGGQRALRDDELKKIRDAAERSATARLIQEIGNAEVDRRVVRK